MAFGCVGEACNFAHGRSELRPLQPKVKVLSLELLAEESHLGLRFRCKSSSFSQHFETFPSVSKLNLLALETGRRASCPSVHHLACHHLMWTAALHPRILVLAVQDPRSSTESNSSWQSKARQSTKHKLSCTDLPGDGLDGLSETLILAYFGAST